MRNKKGQFINGHTYNLGRKLGPMSEEQKMKLSLIHRSRIGTFKGKKHTLESKRKISLGCKGHPSWNKGNKGYRAGKSRLPLDFKHSLETKLKMSKSRMGIKNPNLQTSITPTSLKIRKSLKMSLWRELIFKRDSYACQLCRNTGIPLEAHHIIPFSKFPKFRYTKNNGITLCKVCHLNIRGNEWLYIPKFANL